jgi:NAD(P)H-hydrate repair Nnr-like enzyme with NAD(P)H-hydrate dehydratase domain
LLTPCLSNQLSTPNLILDADALWFLPQIKPNFGEYAGKVVLTPNGIEFMRLWQAMTPKDTELKLPTVD